MKPYICAQCDEHRDAKESPPTLARDGYGLICENCQNDEEHAK